MLVEIKCDKFISNGKHRPPISFHTGLNTVLGSETGSNSIGKSTFLMIVDFTFGGDDYVLKSTDVQTQVGVHTIQFAFEFDDKRYYFSRDTLNHTIVKRCEEGYKPTSEISINDYRLFLLDMYGIKLPLISFRDIVGRYFRIYKRENLDEEKPLNAVKKEADTAAITALMKLFNAYAAIAELAKEVEKSKKEKETYKKAQDFHFILRVGKRQIIENEKKIAELMEELQTLQTNGGIQLMGLDSKEAETIAELKRKLSSVKRQKSKLTSQLTSVENDAASDSPQLQSNFHELLRFFPGTDLKKLEEIELFHRQLAEVLNCEFNEAKQRLSSMISLTENEIAALEHEINSSGLPAKVSRAVLENYSEKKEQIRALEKENATFNKVETLKAAAKSMEDRFFALQEEQISYLQSRINTKMDKINDYVYGGEKRPPVLTISKPNSYSFRTQDDSGTGTSYKGLVVFDLTVLELTPLPALVHDSVILKQIADEPLEKILELYRQSSKQVFIALDKKSSYLKRTQQILEESEVLKLSDDGNELFGHSWNSK